MYELRATDLARAGLAAIVVGVAGGIVWWLIPPILSFFIFLLAAGLGYVMAQAITRFTGGKRGRPVQTAAVAGILLAFVLRNFLLHGALLVIGVSLASIFDYISVVIAVLVALSPLR